MQPPHAHAKMAPMTPYSALGVCLAWSAASLAGCAGGETSSVRGSARLPDCSDPPAADLDGTTWYDTGAITIQTAGCDQAQGQVLEVCPLQWVVSQSGADLSLTVDNEYTVKGRLCGDELHLEGGWWLPVVDDQGECRYRDADGTEVGIEQEGSTLTLSATQLSGSLVVRERCVARYDVTFELLYGTDAFPSQGADAGAD
jgi:hypothetical protein